MDVLAKVGPGPEEEIVVGKVTSTRGVPDASVLSSFHWRRSHARACIGFALVKRPVRYLCACWSQSLELPLPWLFHIHFQLAMQWSLQKGPEYRSDNR